MQNLLKKKPTKSIVKKEPKSNHVIFSYLRTESKYFLHSKKHEVVIHEKREQKINKRCFLKRQRRLDSKHG